MEWVLGIFTELTKTALGAVLLFLGALFWRQPKVEVQYKSRGGGTGAGSSSNTLLCYWKSYLVLYNPGPHDAFDLQVDEIRPQPKWLRVGTINQKHLRATDRLQFPVDVELELSKDEVVAARSKHGVNELEPVELQNLECRLSYRNTWGKRFYTKFRRSRGGDIVTYHRFKPKLDAL